MVPREGLFGFGNSQTSCEQHALMLRRLKHSQLQNVLIRHKAQQFTALKTLHRSVQLRQQLSHARAAVSSAAGRAGSPTPPPLDPNVKALIEKLTELAEIFPTGFRDGERRQSRQRSSYRAIEPMFAEQTSAATGYPSRPNSKNNGDEGGSSPMATTVQQAASRRLVTGSEIGATLEKSRRDRSEEAGALTPEAEEAEDEEAEDGVDDEDADITSERGLEGPSVPSDETRTIFAEDDELFDMRVGALSNNMKKLFADLENAPEKDKYKDNELPRKTGAPESLSQEDKAELKQEAENRRKERAALLAQLDGLSSGGLTRRPKWRWIEDGVLDPAPDRILKGKQLWQAAALLIIVFFVRPRRRLMQRKARSKDRDAQDWNATLAIYFDRCQTWLLKTSRVPMSNSVLKNGALNFRLNRIDSTWEAYGAATPGGVNTRGGFVSTLVRKMARGVTHENLPLTLMRLKVHAKGVLNGLTQEMPPSDIMTFFSYLAADGNYFPQGFFFEKEADMLFFDELGAVRSLTPTTDPPNSLDDTLYASRKSDELAHELNADSQGHQDGFLDAHHLGWLAGAGHSLFEGAKAGKAGLSAASARSTDLRTAVLNGRKTLPGKMKPVFRQGSNGQWFDTSFVEMILTNYLMVRVLIPWILLYPKESGLIPSRGVKPSLLLHNCQVLASTVYLIVRVLRPELTPPNAETLNVAITEETLRAKRVAAAGHEDGDEHGRDKSDGDDDSSSDGGGSENEAGADGSNDNKRGARKKLGALRRGSRNVAAPVRPRTVPEIMHQQRYVSITDKQLIPGLLPDVYFLPFAEQMRPWVLTLAAEFDAWMQNVVAEVMGKVHGSTVRQEGVPSGGQGD